MRQERLYTREFGARVERKLPQSIVDEMARWGWNPLGVYEMVKTEMREHRKIFLPVFVDEIQATPRTSGAGTTGGEK